jgi:hypothetical protein
MYRDLSTIQNGIESCHKPAKITKHENIVHPPWWEGQFVHSPAQITWSTTTARHAWTAMSSAWTIIHLVESTWTAWSWYFELTSPWNICFQPQKPVGFDHHNSFSGIFLQHVLGYLKPGPWGLKNQLKSWAKIQIVFHQELNLLFIFVHPPHRCSIPDSKAALSLKWQVSPPVVHQLDLQFEQV